MNDLTSSCGCAQAYARAYPDMSAAELAVVHSGACPIRLNRLELARRRAAGQRGARHRDYRPPRP